MAGYLALPGPPRTDGDMAKLALAVQGSKGPDDRYDSSSDEDDPSHEYPPGPVSAETTTVGGPGFAGGSAGAPVVFRVQSRDARGTQLREGGCYVTATVTPGSTALAGGASAIQVDIKDNNDGTYSGTYTVPSRGDYQLLVELNAQPVGGSPFPVFFSPPESSPNTLMAQMGDMAGDGKGGVPANVSREQLAILASQGPSTFPQISIMGPRAAKAQVDFPTDADTVDRSILVGNLSAAVSIEQLKQLFGFCGSVESVRFSGDPERFAIIEYGAPGDAERALAMKGMQVIDRNIEVEGIRVASAASGKSDQPYGGLQLHQMAQVQLAQLQQQSLAAQVAQMRAQAKLNPGANVGKGLPQNSASQKAAALTAIAALSKRLTGGASIASFTDNRGHSPPRAKRRRAVSPTIRYRGDSPRRPPPRERSRDRSRSGRRRSRSRTRSRSRRDSSRSRRDRSRSRQRSARRSPSRSHRDHRIARESEQAFRAPEASIRSDRRSDPHASRDRDHGRSRGHDNEGDKATSERAHRHREHKRRHKSHRHEGSDSERRGSRKHRHREAGAEATGPDQEADRVAEAGPAADTSTKMQQAEQEAELRMRALNSLKSGSASVHENGSAGGAAA